MHIYIYIYKSPGPLANSLLIGPVESYQRLKKMVLDTALFNIQHYKLKNKGKVEQSRELSRVFPNISVL